MTCIAAVKYDGKVYMGGDSAATCQNGNIDILVHPKVFGKNEMVIGGVGSLRALQAVQYSFDPGSPPASSTELMSWLCTTFVDALRECLEDTTSDDDDCHEEGFGGLLLGTQGRIFKVDHDLGVVEIGGPYAAIGSGEGPAMGCLYLFDLLGRTEDPKTAILTALAAAEKVDWGVKGPFYVLVEQG